MNRILCSYRLSWKISLRSSIKWCGFFVTFFWFCSPSYSSNQTNSSNQTKGQARIQTSGTAWQAFVAPYAVAIRFFIEEEEIVRASQVFDRFLDRVSKMDLSEKERNHIDVSVFYPLTAEWMKRRDRRALYSVIERLWTTFRCEEPSYAKGRFCQALREQGQHVWSFHFFETTADELLRASKSIRLSQCSDGEAALRNIEKREGYFEGLSDLWVAHAECVGDLSKIFEARNRRRMIRFLDSN